MSEKYLSGIWWTTKRYFAQQFELSRGGGAHNVRPMEGLRGFAVSLVFLVHYNALVRPFISDQGLLLFSGAVHSIGNAGVDLFFVLSGYLIYGSLISRPQNFYRYMARRLVRIYPTFLVVFAMYLVLSFVFSSENKIPSSLWQGLLYLAENVLLLPGLFQIDPLITVAWSLSYEMFYYLAIPLVIVIFRLRQRSSAWRTWFFIATACAAVICFAVFGGACRLIMFISGILLYEALESRSIAAPNGFVGLFALAIGLASPLLAVPGPIGGALRAAILFGSFFLLCLACFRNSLAPLPLAFSWTPLRWLGNMSYSYYLLHGLTLKAAFLVAVALLPKGADQSYLIFWGLLPVMFTLTLISSSVLFLLIERPFSLVQKH